MAVSNVLIGEGDCTYKQIVDILLMKSVSVKTCEEWRRFADELNVRRDYTERWRKDLLHEKKDQRDVLYDVLTEWKGVNGKNSTLKNLITHLKKIEWIEVSEKLEELMIAFQNKSTENFSLIIGDQDCSFKMIVHILLMHSALITNSNWRTLARELAIEEYNIQKWDQERAMGLTTIHDIFFNVLTEWKFLTGTVATISNLLYHLRIIQWNAVADALENAFQITQKEPEPALQRLPETIPHKLPYYIPRRLLANNPISITALNSGNDSNVFVFFGASYDELKVLENHKLVRSGEMISKESIDARYVLLEQVEDWQKLFEKSKRPLHLVQFENKRLICLRSHGDINYLRKVLITKEGKNEFTENEFLYVVNNREIRFKLNNPVCIADSSGMGKSVLLAEIGRKLKEKYANRDVAYIVITEFIEGIKKRENKLEDMVKSELIYKLCCNDQNLRKKLNLDFNSKNKSISTKYELLLDGFDELETKDFQLGYECIKELVKCLHHCARVWVTTRLHHLEELENCLGVCGYRIEPFNDEDKLNFLIKYWSTKDTKAVDFKRLKDIGENCLSAIMSKLNDRERDILGIPLLCKLLAVVYEPEVKHVCGSDDRNEPAAKRQRLHFEIKSITALYESFIENSILKGLGVSESSRESFERYYEADINQQREFHVILSMELIFQSKVNDIISHDQTAEFKVVKKHSKTKTEILKMGIVENLKDEPRFLHRTIAEYFVAKFLVDSMPENDTEKDCRFFFEMLSSNLYPNIRYFIDCLLKQNPKKYSMNLKTTFSSLEATCSLNDALASLIESNLVNIFKLFHVVFDKELSSKLIESDLVHKAVIHSSVEMINFIYEYYGSLPVISKLKPFPENCSVLEELIKKGDAEKLKYLLKHHGYHDILYKSQFSQPCVYLQACLNSTASINAEPRLQQRLDIFDTLINFNPSNLTQETFHTLCIGLKFSEIHTKLLVELLRNGVEFAEADECNNTLDFEVVSRISDASTLKCFLHAFAEGIWKTTVRLKISEQNILLQYTENDISLTDLKEIPLLCLLLSALEERVEQNVANAVSSSFQSQKRYKALNIISVYESLMQHFSSDAHLDSLKLKSNLNQIQTLLAIKLLDLNLPSEIEFDLTTNLKDHDIYKLYQSLTTELKQSRNFHIDANNIEVVAQCLVADYMMNSFSLKMDAHTVTFLFESLLSVTSKNWSDSDLGKYFKEYIFVFDDLCRVLDKFLSKKNNQNITFSFNFERCIFDILAASLCQGFTNIFSFSSGILSLTLRQSAQAETASINISPLDCFKIIDRIPRNLNFHDVTVKVSSFKEFLLLVAMQEENVDYNMLRNIFVSRVDINNQDDTGCTLLGYAAKKKRYDVANILLEQGANFGTDSQEGQNLLHQVVAAKEYKLFLKVIRLPSLNINEVDIYGNTALHIALMQSNSTNNLPAIVDELCLKGAQLDIKNGNDETPISLAKTRNDEVGNIVIECEKEHMKTSKIVKP